MPELFGDEGQEDGRDGPLGLRNMRGENRRVEGLWKGCEGLGERGGLEPPWTEDFGRFGVNSASSA